MDTKIYTAPHCTHCKRARKFLDMNKIQFTEVNVMEDEKGYREMVEKTHQSGVPVLELKNDIHVGFNQEIFAEVLGIKKRSLLSRLKGRLKPKEI